MSLKPLLVRLLLLSKLALFLLQLSKAFTFLPSLICSLFLAQIGFSNHLQRILVNILMPEGGVGVKDEGVQFASLEE